MKLVTWNVQWCLGGDGRVDPARIVAEARAFADFDVLCLQEVACNFPALQGSSVKTSSRSSPGCCLATPRFAASRSIPRAPAARAGPSAT